MTTALHYSFKSKSGAHNGEIPFIVHLKSTFSLVPVNLFHLFDNRNSMSTFRIPRHRETEVGLLLELQKAALTKTVALSNGSLPTQ
jgi:hypothetical protein